MAITDKSGLGNTGGLQSRPKADSPSEEMSFLGRKPTLLRATLFILLLAAIAVRVNNLGTFQAGDRQFRSAIIARAYYLMADDSVPEWRKELAERSLQRAGLLEPPIMELLVSWIYRLMSAELLRIPGFLSSTFWVVGGIFLYKIAERIASVDAAVFATAYYVLVPTGVHISRGFVPDPLMIALFLLGILLIIRYYEYPSKSRLLGAAVVSGLAVFVKPFCLFALLGAFISLALYQNSSWKRVIDFQLIVFLSIILLPLLYYSSGILTGGYLSSQAQASFLPSLLLTRSYWQGWLTTASAVVGTVPLVGALVGLPMLRKGLPRTLLIGLSLGYVVFCLLFTYHIRFGPHYHTQLVIIVALCIGPLVASVTEYLRQSSNKWYWWLPVIGAVLLVSLFAVGAIRDKLLASRGFQGDEIAQEIGQIVDHSSRVVYVAPDYGTPLEYYAELSGEYWPRRTSDTHRALGYQLEQSVEERLAALDFAPEYFVITDLDEFNRHHTDLKEFLADNYPLLAESDDYLIYRVPED